MPSKYRRSTRPKSSPTGKKAGPTGTDADLNLHTLSALFTDETKAREFIEARRWPDGVPVCPHCGEHGAYKLTAKPGSKHPVRAGVYKCKACRKPFSVRIGTIFEESKIPLCKWLMAIHLMTSSKKGISSHQIARELDVTVKTGWFLTHRIRECMKQGEPLLTGVVEQDECWVGGKPRPKHGHPRKRLSSETNKQPVAVLVERDGQAYCKVIDSASVAELKAVASKASTEAILMTDGLQQYLQVGPLFRGHYSVNHSAGEYARKLESGLVAHNNTAESFFALLKRGHYGIFHQLSKHHLQRYCTEFAFRWKYRKTSDGHRMMAAVDGAEGKRLKYKTPR